MLVSSPIMYAGRFLGMIATVVDLDYLIRQLQQVSLTGLMPYVVDSQGRLVAAASNEFATGQEMTQFDIVKNFVDEGSKAQLVATREFAIHGEKPVVMLGTYSPVTALDWPSLSRSRGKKPIAEFMKCSVRAACSHGWPCL